MKIKKVIGIAAVFIIIIVVAEILGYSMAYARITEEYKAVLLRTEMILNMLPRL